MAVEPAVAHPSRSRCLARSGRGCHATGTFTFIGYPETFLASSTTGKILTGMVPIQECYNTLIYNADIVHVPCVKLAISKGLGLGIVIFGTIMKVPQMLKIISAQSAAGISLGMYVLETLAYTISLAYAYRKQLPFSTYGENASLTVQSTFLFFSFFSSLPRSVPTPPISSLLHAACTEDG